MVHKRSAASPMLESRIHSLSVYKRPAEIYQFLRCELDQAVWERAPGTGRELARRRSEVHDFFVASAFGDLLGATPFKEECAVIAHGGYGRQELVPNSDIDIMLLVENIVSNENPLVSVFEQRVQEFSNYAGFTLKAGVNSLANIRSLTAKDVNSLLDARYLVGNASLATRFRQQVQEQHENHELFFHNLSLWEKARQTQTRDLDDVSSFNIKTGRGGLRNLQTGVWVQCLPEFHTSASLYEQLTRSDPAVLESLDILLAVRAWLNLAKEGKRNRKQPLMQQSREEGGKQTPSAYADILQREDFVELGESWRESLLTARRIVERFTSGIIAKELKEGIPLGKFLHTVHGLYWPEEHVDADRIQRTQDFFELVQEAQRHGISIDKAQYQSTLRDVASWIQPHQGFVNLFYERGSLAASLQTLSGLGVLERMIPYFTQLEVAIHEASHREPQLTFAGFARQKISVLEQLIGEESPHPYLTQECAALAPDHAAAIKLALLVKCIPTLSPEHPGVTPHSVTSYVRQLGHTLPFSSETLSMASFLLTHHSLLSEVTHNSLSDEHTIACLMEKVRTKEHLRALTLFTYADHGKLDDAAETMHLWQNIRELHHKTMNRFVGRSENVVYDPSTLAPEESAIARDLGPDFMSSVYAPHAPSWIPQLVRVAQNREPIIRPLRDPPVWGIAAPDYPGLMAVVTGEHYRLGLNVQQAHTYLLSQHGLSLSFFGLALGQALPKDYATSLAAAITARKFIAADPGKILDTVMRRACLDSIEGTGLYRLTFTTDKDAKGILYALTSVLHEKLNAAMYAIKAHVTQGRIDDHIFFKTPYDLPEARARVAQYIAPVS